MAYVQQLVIFLLIAPSAATDADSAECLLQNQFVSDKQLSADEDRSRKLSVPLGGESEEDNKVALFEVSSLGEARRISHERRSEFKAHSFLLRRALASLFLNATTGHGQLQAQEEDTNVTDGDALLLAVEDTPGVYVCAGERGYCPCVGTIFYGKKFKNGRPGSGEVLSFDELKASGRFKSWASTEGSRCGNIKGDPDYGYHKQCFCQKSDPTAPHVCAVEGGMCQCKGSITYGKRFVSGRPGAGKTLSFDEVKKSGQFKQLTPPSGVARCDTRTMGGDPSPFYYKQCWCEEAQEEDGFSNLGAGCCKNRKPPSMPFKGMVADLGACKAKCQGMDNCGFIEYGWKKSRWCTVIPKGTDCSTLTAGPRDCGSGGGNNGVRTYQLLEAPAETTPAPEATPAETPKEFKVSTKGSSCADSFGATWKPATVLEVASWCGCAQEPATTTKKRWCLCPKNLSPLLGKRGPWTLVGLEDGQAMGSGYKYNVKYAPKTAENTALDLCVEGTADASTSSPSTTALTTAAPEAASEPEPIDENPYEIGEEEGEESEDFPDLGAGCCSNRDPKAMLFKGMVADLDACKAKCQSLEDCGNIEYGWKNSKWCTVLPAGVDCSELAAGPKDCGSGGGDNGVHTYAFLTAEEATPLEEQCEKFSLQDNKYVQNTPTEIPGATATSIKNVFVSHAGVMNGAYVNGAGKKVQAVRRKKGTKNQYLLGIWDDNRYAKMVEITLGLKAGTITVAVTGARYKAVTEAVAKTAYSTSEKMTKFWNTGHGQRIARSDREAGYGIKGLQIKSCLENADAIKAGKQMDDLIDDFIDAQAGSEDACHSQLLEARHQLNQLHAMVADLARQVNATEEQIMVYDKMLEERLEEMSELGAWKDKELEKCKAEKLKAGNMFAKLKVELEEMHQIASPSVAMDVKDGKLHEVSLAQQMARHLTVKINANGGEDADHLSALQDHLQDHLSADHLQDMKELSALQTDLAAHLAPVSQGHVLRPAKLPAAHDVSKVSGLIADTQQASLAFRSCMNLVNAPKGAVSLINGEKPKKTEAECQAEKDALEKTYVKAYVELSRLKAEYEELANSTACVDTTLEQYKNRKTPLQKEADKLATAINEKVAELQSLRPRLESAIASEEKLRKQVKKLTNQCDDLGPTVSDLNKVREAIRALSACPGLSRVKFSLPKWVGTWATFAQDGKGQTDKQQDKQMNMACSKIAPGSRAAEVGEIQEQTVEGIPTTNTASSPLLGACPDCEGDDDKWFQSGHSRVCWDADAALDFDSRRDNCGTGKKSILCVMDRADIRQIPGKDGGTDAAGTIQKRMAALIQIQMAAISAA